jgi:GT2 family glycosyltransferase
MSIPLSVVIPSHRRPDLLRLCLESVMRFAPARTEVIVVDDGSLGAVAALMALGFPGTRIVRLTKPHGFCLAVNRGIETARGEIVELLNDDTQVTAGWADAALRCFADPRVGAVAPLVLRGIPGDPEVIDSAGDDYDPGGFASKRGRGQTLSADYLQSCFVPAASGSSVFLRRSALERSGLFAEHFGAYFEDVDLSLRLRAAGYVMRYEPTSIVWHRVGGSYGPPRRRLVEQQSCNEERLFWRHLDRRRPWRSLARHAAVLVGKALRRYREGRFLPFAFGRLRACAEAIGNHY